MGNTFAKQNLTFYFYKLAAFRPTLEHTKFISIDNIDAIDWQKCYKLLMPINQVIENYDQILRRHHQIILIRCGFQQQRVLANKFRFMQIQFFNKIKNDQSLLFKSDIYQQENSNLASLVAYQQPCPMAFIFNEMHYLAVRHCRKSLAYYNLPSILYSHPLQFFQSGCQTSQIICGMKELEYIIDKILIKKFTCRENININVFCKTQNITQMNTLKSIGLQRKINIDYSDNFLSIIQCILSQNSLPLSLGQIKIPIQRIFLIMNGKSHISQDDASSLKKFGKRLKSIQFKKVQFLQDLPSKLKKHMFSTLIIDRSIKNFVQVSNILEQHGLSDRVFLIRKKTQVSEQLKQRIMKFTRNNCYQGVRKQLKKVIAIGSQKFLYRLLVNIPCIEVKLFIKPDQHERIIEILGRQNQIIIVKLQILKVLRKQSQLHSQIVCYQPNQGINRDYYPKTCQKIDFCHDQDSFLKIMNEQKLPFVIPFSYEQKKVSYICEHISNLFSRLVKQNLVIKENFDNIVIFSCQNWIFDQITNLLTQVLASKYMANFYIEAIFLRIKGKIGEQILKINQLFSIEQETIKSILQIEEEEAFSYCQRFMVMVCKSRRFKTILNQLWSQMLYQKHMEHLLFTPYIFFVIFLSFSKTKKMHQVVQQKVRLKIQGCKFDINSTQHEQFINKIRLQQNVYVYSFQFLYCSQIPEGKGYYQPMVVQIESHQITSFRPFFNFHRFGKYYIIPPLTKLKICPNSNNFTLVLQAKYMQKFWRKFSHRYFQFQTSLMQLVPTQPHKQELIKYMKHMETKKYISAQSTICQLIKFPSSDLEKKILTGYMVITLIKRRMIKSAQKALLIDNPFYSTLKKYIELLKNSINEKNAKQINQTLSCRSKNKLINSQLKKKWRVDYLPDLQKFGIVGNQKQTQYETYSEQNFQIIFSSKSKEKAFLQIKISIDENNQNDQILDSYDSRQQETRTPKLFVFAPNQMKNNSSLISESDLVSNHRQKADSFSQQSSQVQRLSYKLAANSAKQLYGLFKNSVVPQNKNKNDENYFDINQKHNIFAIMSQNGCRRNNLLPKLPKKQKISYKKDTNKNKIFYEAQQSNLSIIKQLNQNEKFGSGDQQQGQERNLKNKLSDVCIQSIQQSVSQEAQIE